MHGAPVDRQRHVAHPAHQEVARSRSGWASRALRLGTIIWSRSLHTASIRVRQPGAGSASSRDQVAARAELAGQAVRHQLGRAGAAVRGAERHQRVHPGVAAEPLHVVAGDQAAHAVPDDVDPLEAGLLAELLDPRGEAGGREPDVAGERAVVQRDHPVEAATAQRPAQQREDRPVVDHAVHQQDRRAGRLDVADDQAALQRREPPEVAAADVPVPGPLRDDAERVERGVGGDPADLDGGTAQARGGQRAGGPPPHRTHCVRTGDPLAHPVPSHSTLIGRSGPNRNPPLPPHPVRDARQP